MKSSSRSAFTLLELLLAIALIALLATALIAGSVSLLNDKPTSPDEVFWQASLAARKAALQGGFDIHNLRQGGTEVRLSFDGTQKAFIADDGADPAQTFAIPKASSDLVVALLAPEAPAAADASSPAGAADDNPPLPYVCFYSDGTCSPFRAQIRSKGGAHSVPIDPWTCAKMLVRPPSP